MNLNKLKLTKKQIKYYLIWVILNLLLLLTPTRFSYKGKFYYLIKEYVSYDFITFLILTLPVLIIILASNFNSFKNKLSFRNIKLFIGFVFICFTFFGIISFFSYTFDLGWINSDRIFGFKNLPHLFIGLIAISGSILLASVKSDKLD